MLTVFMSEINSYLEHSITVNTYPRILAIIDMKFIASLVDIYGLIWRELI